MVDRLGANPYNAAYSQLQSQLMGVPTPGFGYLLQPQDTLSALLSAAYGPPGLPFAPAFMGMNSHLGAPGAFDNLGALAGQLLYFPMLAQLQQAAAMGALPPGFGAMDQLFAQAGLPAGAAASFFAPPAMQAMANPVLQQQLMAALATGYVPGAAAATWPKWVDSGRTILPEDVIRGGARDAIREGRTFVGPRGTTPTDGRVDAALGGSWTPRTGAPNRLGVVPMSQLDYNQQLGNGGRTIRQAGCFMTSLTMAATKITGDTSLNPAVANDRIRANGGFSGSNLNLDRGAAALGMKVVERSEITPGNVASAVGKIDRSLEAGRPVVVGVDYKAGSSSGRSNADHFVTITGRNADGSYSAVDPAGGREITFRRGADGMLHAQSGSKSYTVAEMTLLDRR